MTEFKRTTALVEEAGLIVKDLLDGRDTDRAHKLALLIGELSPTIDKFRRKVAETDRTKQIYGPIMVGKVQALVTKWTDLETLANDLLDERGIDIPMAQMSSLTSMVGLSSYSSHAATSGENAGARNSQATNDPASTGANPSRRMQAVAQDAVPIDNACERRRLAAQAPEARFVSPGGIANPNPDGDPVRPVDGEPSATTNVSICRMVDLLGMVHGVFLGHGFAPLSTGAGSVVASSESGGRPFKIRYTYCEKMIIVVAFVPVQQHLVVYASTEGNIENDASNRVALRLGMTADSISAKVEYLLVYPLVLSQKVPVLVEVPPEVSFNVFWGLMLPSLAALGVASKGMSRLVFEDELLWWHIAMSLPGSHQCKTDLDEARNAQCDGRRPRTFMLIVKDEVLRRRHEAEERRRLEENIRRAREAQNRRRHIQPEFPFNPGFGIVGGDRDLLPGGGVPDLFGNGGRRPFGPGGGGFGGGIF